MSTPEVTSLMHIHATSTSELDETMSRGGGDDNSTAHSESHVSPYDNTVSLKRDLSVDGDFERDEKKRRFVWPEALHKDFLSAIFDVGLKNATPAAVLECMIREDTACLTSGKVHAQNIHIHLSKLLTLRDRARREYTSYYEKSLAREGRHSILQDAAFASSEAMRTLSDEKLALNQKLFLLRKQLDAVNSTISVQSSFLNLVKASMEAQLKSQAGIIQMISHLDPSYTASLKNNNLQQQQLLSSLPSYTHPAEHVAVAAGGAKAELEAQHGAQQGAAAAAGSTRVELQIMSEMRTHMDLHRQLMLRKEDQVSQFSSKASAPPAPLPQDGPSSSASLLLNKMSSSSSTTREDTGTGPLALTVGDSIDGNDWNWDDDCLDEHLFNFLSTTASSNPLGNPLGSAPGQPPGQ